jgi:DNA-binding CsgD family transcriptional regulator
MGTIPPCLDEFCVAEKQPDAATLFTSISELDCWSALDGCGRILLGREGDFLSADRLATKLIDCRLGLCCIDGRVRPTAADQQRRFDYLLAAPISSPRTMLLTTKSQMKLLLHSVACGRDGADFVALQIKVIDAEAEPEFACLGEAFGLTPAEEQIASELLRGQSANEIARRLRLSINTVRSHISHVYHKLQTTNREGMWRTFASYRLR